MATVVGLMSRGYLPEVLPPTFTSASMSDVLAAGVPPALLPPGQPSATKTFPFSCPRFGIHRRIFGIPNPISQVRLAHTIDSNWPSIDTHCGASTLSITKPRASQDPTDPREVLPDPGFGGWPARRASDRAGGRYLVKTDVSSFYPTAYTHSIPWAVHTKAFAKLNHGLAHYGNRLDRDLRLCQDRQSIGMPVGPDTSLVLAEVLMTAVDHVIEQELGHVSGHRFMDDFEFVFPTLSRAEEGLAVVTAALAEYELAINPRKTRIAALPLPLEDSWAIELRQFRIRDTDATQRTDLISFFSRAFELGAEDPNTPAVKYAVTRAAGTQILGSNAEIAALLALQAAAAEPASLPRALELLSTLEHAGSQIPLAALEETLNSIVRTHAPVGHGFEVAWALWGALRFQCLLDAQLCAPVGAMEDPVVALSAIHAQQAGLFHGGHLPLASWQPWMTGAALHEREWLVAYEANIKGWLPNVDPQDHVTADHQFGVLKNAGVSFYDTTRVTHAAIADAALTYAAANPYDG